MLGIQLGVNLEVKFGVGNKTGSNNSVLAFLKFINGSVLAFLKCTDWVNPSKRGGMDEVFRGLAGQL